MILVLTYDVSRFLVAADVLSIPSTGTHTICSLSRGMSQRNYDEAINCCSSLCQSRTKMVNSVLRYRLHPMKPISLVS